MSSSSDDAIKIAVPSAKLELLESDLASLKSIRAFAKTYKSKYDRLDVLINSRAGAAAYNESDAKRLWELSEELTSVKYDALYI